MTDPRDTKAVTAANLAAWEEAAPIHRRHNQAALLQAFSQAGHSCLDERETAVLQRLGVAGKAVAQLCCNNGRELLSVKNLGAGACVGFEGAPGFVEQGRELAAAAGQDIKFVCGDIYDIDATYNGAFDLVTVTIGVLGWMPDLPRFFAVAARLLRPGGALFIYEQHPILDMFKPGAAGDPVEWELSYFEKAPYVETEGLDYYGGEVYAAKPVTSFGHTLAEVVMAGIGNGLAVESLEEHPDHISNTWWNLEAAGLGLPMCYTLVLRKGS